LAAGEATAAGAAALAAVLEGSAILTCLGAAAVLGHLDLAESAIISPVYMGKTR